MIRMNKPTGQKVCIYCMFQQQWLIPACPSVQSEDCRAFAVDRNFLTCGIEFVLFLVVLQNSVLPMGLDSSHATLKWRKKFLIFQK